MAKIAYTKLGAKIDSTIINVDINGNMVEVRAYLPLAEKLNLIARVIELSHDIDYNYANPLKTEVYFALEAIRAYTNITFTDKQLEDPQKLYDALSSSGVIDIIFKTIPEAEMTVVRNNIEATQKAFYAYRTSVIGLLEHISTDYSDLDLDITKLQEKFANGENLELVKNIIEKLG